MLVLLVILPARAAEWPMYRHDIARSSITDDPLDFPLRPAWVYVSPQAPAPAWPEPEKNLNRLDFDYAPHPVIADGIVCFGSSADDTIRALDAKTGVVQWQFVTGGPVRFAPQIANGKVYAASDDGLVYCLAAGTGKLLWSFRPVAADERMLGNGRMISRWPIRSGVLVDKGVAYFAAGMWAAEGVFLYALDAETGKVRWCNDTCNTGLPRISHAVYSLTGINPQGALLATDDYLVLPMGRSTPAAFDRKTGRLLAYQPGGLTNGTGGSWATISGNLCYVYGKNFYSSLGINGLTLPTMQIGKGFRSGVPNHAMFVTSWQYSLYDGKVCALVDKDQVVTRYAYGLAKVGDLLVIGKQDQVALEGSAQKPLARVRMAVAGSDLAISASVVDYRVAVEPRPWEGSCIEVFGAPEAKGPIGQVFLTPAVGETPARAYRAVGEKFEVLPDVRVQSQPVDDGYTLQALIPLPLLKLDPATEQCSLELQFTATSPNGDIKRNTLFGSTLAYMNTEHYCRFRLLAPGAKAPANSTTELLMARLRAIAAVAQIDEAVAAEPAFAVSVTQEKELWRAAVHGQAREIAVANGCLFVATTTGEITCFAPFMQGDKTEPAVIDPGAALRNVRAPEPRAGDAELLKALQAAGMTRGYALVLGDADGAMVKMLAARTGLHVISALPEPAASALRRELIATTTWYGSRIHVNTVDRFDRLPFAQYFANAVIVAGEAPGLTGNELFRLVRPIGGVLLLPGLSRAQAEALFAEAGGTRTTGAIAGVVRGRLAGAHDWDAPAADALVRWPLRPAWFGEPGPDKSYNRKYTGQTLAGANGRVFINSDDEITAVDAYNGFLWWTRPLPFSPRGNGATLNADGESVYLTLPGGFFGGQDKGCVQLDALTGHQQKVYATYAPVQQISLAVPQTWSLTLKEKDQETAAGTVTLQKEPACLVLTLSTPAAAPKTTRDWSLYLDFRPWDQRFGLYEPGVYQYLVFPARDDKSPASWRAGTGTGHPRITVFGTVDTERTVTTVRLAWADLTDGEVPESFGFGLSLSVRPVLNPLVSLLPPPSAQSHLFCLAAADGMNNGWAAVYPGAAPAVPLAPPAIIAGTFAALSKDKWQPKYVRVAGDIIGAYRTHPFTGQAVPKTWTVGDGCGGYATSATSVITRSASLGFYDFVDDSGTRVFPGVRFSCGVSAIAAFGVLVATDGGAGCECTYNFETSLGFAPAERRLNEDWALFYDWNADTLLRQAHINLGAPGDRRDAQKALWVGYPRPVMEQVFPQTPGGAGWFNIAGVWQQKIPMVLQVPLELETAEGFGPYRVSADRVAISGTDRPWIYASGYRGIKKATFRLNFLPSLTAQAAKAELKIDGKLDEPEWAGEPTTKLAQTNTAVYLRYDDMNLYVATRRPPRVDRLGKTLPWQTAIKGKDAPVFNGDALEMFIADGHGGSLCLAVGASGAQFDARANGKQEYDARWNADWTSAVFVNEKEFIVETAIPWQVLTGAGLAKESLAMNLQIDSQWNLGEALVRLGGRGRALCENFVPLGLGTAPATAGRQFTVRLHFAEVDEVKPGQRVFDVKIQGQTVLKDFDIAKTAGIHTAVVKEFTHIPTADALTVEFIPTGALTLDSAPILSGIELVDEGQMP